MNLGKHGVFTNHSGGFNNI